MADAPRDPATLDADAMDDVQTATPQADAPAHDAAAPADDDRSAYEKAASGDGDIDPRCIPQTLDERPPIGDEIAYPDYDEEDHAIWRTLVERQTQYLPGRACKAFLKGMDTLDLGADRLPSLAALSRRLEDATGWRVARVPGLIHEKNFFELLSERIFPSTNYVRRRDELDYTPAPDCFHDIFGHMPMLTQPDFADFYQMFGHAALKAEGADRPRLERFHWFTVEFGLIQEEDGTRIFGAGIVSSKNEVTHALSDEVTVHPFDPAHITEKDYDVWHLQDELFRLASFEQLVDGFRGWCLAKGLLPA
jgi:phenylalanine-4-hydroxylase